MVGYGEEPTMEIQKKCPRFSEPITRSSAILCREVEEDVSRQLFGASGAKLARPPEISGANYGTV